MKKNPLYPLLCSLLAFLILSQCTSFFQSAFAVTLIGNITISGNDVLPIVNGQFDVRGNIYVEGNGTLFLKNAILNLDQTAAYQYAVIFRNPAGGNPRLIAENATLMSSKWFNVYFDGNSSAKADKFDLLFGRIYVKGDSNIVFSNFRLKGSLNVTESSTVVIHDSTMKELHRKVTGSFEAYGSSAVSIFNSTLVGPLTYESSTVYIANSMIEDTLRAFDSSRVVVINSTREWQVRSQDSSAIIISGSVMVNASTYESSVVSILDTTMTGLDAYDSSIVSISGSGMEALRVYNHSKVTVLSSIMTGTTGLDAGGSSVVSLRGTTMEGLSVRESSVVSLSNSTIGWFLYALDSSKVDLSNSKAKLIHVSDSSSVSMSGSRINMLRSSDFSTASISESTVDELLIRFNSVDSYISGLKPSVFNRWNSLTDLSISRGQGGYAPDVTLTNTEIRRGWSFFFSGLSNVTIVNSDIEHLSSSGSSVARLINSTLNSYHVTSGSKMFVYWYVDVFVVSGASVTVWHSNGTLVESKFADESGFATFTLLERLVDESTVSSYGNYTVGSSWNGNSEQQSVELTGSETLNMISLPWWQLNWQLLLGLVAVLAVGMVAFFVIRRRRKFAST